MKPYFSIKKIYSVSILVSVISAACYMSVNAEEKVNREKLISQKAELVKKVLGRDPLAVDAMAELEKARERIKEISGASAGSPNSKRSRVQNDEISPFIVGGVDSEPGARPYQVALEIPGLGLNCGGSIIADKWILTAAHCVGPIYTVKVDTVDLNSGGQVLEVAHEVLNPNFDGATFENDVSLLRLVDDAPANLTRLKLADDSVMAIAGNPGDIATASGWGRLFTGGPISDILQQVDVPIISNAVCDAAYEDLFGVSLVRDNMICAGYAAGGQDTCNGDSGGPLTVTVDGEDYSAGVVSWGSNDCASAGAYGVYARTSTQLDWISAAMEAPVVEFGALELGQEVTDLSSVAAGQLLYSFELEQPFSADQGTLDFTLTGGTGDAFLYVYEGDEPTLTSYLCRSASFGTEQICSVTDLPPGSYTIGVAAFTDFEGVSLSSAVVPPPPITPIENGVALTDLSAQTGEALYFSLDVPEEVLNMSVVISGGTGDADLLVFQGNATDGLLLCATFSIGNQDVCSFNGMPAGSYTIVMIAFAAFEGVTLEANYTSNRLENGVPVTGLSGLAADELGLRVVVEERSANLEVSISGGTGDADLYLRYGEEPTRRVFDCAPFLPGNEETCNIADVPAGTYYVMLHGYEDFADVSLVASYDEYVPPASCSYDIISVTRSKVRAEISITNESDLPIDGWSVNWEYSDDTNLIYARKVEVSGDNPYTATNTEKNRVIEAGETATFLIIAEKGSNKAEVPVVTGDICK